MNEELKPCPFHNCLTCGCYDITDISDKAWNTRPIENQLRAKIERLQAALREIADYPFSTDYLDVNIREIAEKALGGEEEK